MKTLSCSILLLALAATHLSAQETGNPVHLRPSSDSPVIGNLPRGAPLTAPAEPVQLSARERERGWEALSFVDDFKGFVKRTDLTKDLKVVPGAAVYLSAAEDASRLITRAHLNDLFEVEKLSGNWVEVSFRKPVTAFVRAGEETSAPRQTVEVATITDEPAAPAESAKRPVISDRGAIPSDGILRSFEGYLGQPRAFFGRVPLYPYQIVDASGNRIAYLDLSRLLITVPLEHTLGREYNFYGRAEPIEGRRDFVIRVERMLQK